MKDAGKAQKIPMGFVYGAEDMKANKNALNYVKLIRPKYSRDRSKNEPDDWKATGDFGVKTSLMGSKLLNGAKSRARDWIVKDYLGGKLFTDRLDNEWEKRETEKYPFVWSWGRTPIQAKGFEEKYLNPIPLTVMGLR